MFFLREQSKTYTIKQVLEGMRKVTIWKLDNGNWMKTYVLDVKKECIMGQKKRENL